MTLEIQLPFWHAHQREVQALRTLTGENPVARDSSYDACRAAWLAWGRKRGLIAQVPEPEERKVLNRSDLP